MSHVAARFSNSLRLDEWFSKRAVCDIEGVLTSFWTIGGGGVGERNLRVFPT